MRAKRLQQRVLTLCLCLLLPAAAALRRGIHRDLSKEGRAG